MSFGLYLFGSRELGRSDVCDKAADRAFGGAVFGTQFFGFAESVEGEITGDAIAIGGGDTTGRVGSYAVLQGNVGISGSVTGALQLVGLVSAEVGISGTVTGAVSYVGEITGDAIGISGSASGALPLYGEITGDAIGISGQVYGGSAPSYDKVGARLLIDAASGRLLTQTVRGRYLNDTVKGRF